jgi:phosphoribosylanthranilate isomerase
MGYHLRIKICGLTTPGDARTVVDFGADAIGLNFYSNSPRYVEDERAAAILEVLPPFVEAVAVFAGEAPDAMVQRVHQFERIRAIQSHGTWPEPASVRPHGLILAVHVTGPESLIEVSDYLARSRNLGAEPAAILVDGSVRGQFGGTGKTAPWSLLANFRPGVPLILAGGLTPANVAEAVRIVRPFAVDVASGVESTPGRKDPDKVRRFIANARSAAAGLSD